MDRLLKRLQKAIESLELGIPRSSFESNRLGATNRALRAIGRPPMSSFESEVEVLRATLSFEAAID
jgi:hypothetical protein